MYLKRLYYVKMSATIWTFYVILISHMEMNAVKASLSFRNESNSVLSKWYVYVHLCHNKLLTLSYSSNKNGWIKFFSQLENLNRQNMANS